MQRARLSPFMLVSVLAACSSGGGYEPLHRSLPVVVAPATSADPNREQYAYIDENDFVSPRNVPLSTFGVDVDRASYANVRRFLSDGQLPPVDAVRIEELINYFHYDYPEPAADMPFSVTTEVSAAPWREGHQLLRIGLRTRSIPAHDLPASNLVFLIDVSGSMQSADKLPLVKSALALLVDQLRPRDRVAIVVYAGAAGLVLPPTPGNRRVDILAAIDRLEAGGSTAGGAGIRLAYEVARESFIDGGNNRVILATDGDFNVGASSDSDMIRLIERERESGVFLSVLGFGTGNLQDAKMEQIADHGNGNFAYIDDILEARKVFIEEFGGTLVTVAKDVKLQVEFNPALVAAYRLIGYENRALEVQEFDDDSVDSGDMGAGHAVTALYEIVPVGAETDVATQTVTDLRYQDRAPSSDALRGEVGFVRIRYKAPAGDESRLLEMPIAAQANSPSTDTRFASAVAAFGMLLRESPHRGDASVELVRRLAGGALGDDRLGYRADFVDLVERFAQIGEAGRRANSGR